MKIGKYHLKTRFLIARVFGLLGRIWNVPFAYYVQPIRATGRVPSPLKPRCYQDLILRNMMFPDNILRAVTADKIAARGWMMEKIGAEYATALYGVFDDVDALSQRNFPYPYVVKTNHASGQYYFVRDDQSRQDMLMAARSWDMGVYNPDLEWTYHDIEPKFMVEKMLISEDQSEVIDIKLYCFHGEPLLIHRISDREGENAKTFFTTDWKMKDIYLLNPTAMLDAPKPDYLQELLNLGRVLAEDFEFCRVDFMEMDGKLYFGELTSTTAAGTTHFKPISFDRFLYQEFERLGREKIAAQRVAYSQKVMTMFGIKSGTKND